MGGVEISEILSVRRCVAETAHTVGRGKGVRSALPAGDSDGPTTAGDPPVLTIGAASNLLDESAKSDCHDGDKQIYIPRHLPHGV